MNPPLAGETLTATLHSVTGSGSTIQAEVPGGELPSVLILTPVKNAVGNLERYFELIESLSYPKHLVSLGFLESDSTDGTFDVLRTMVEPLRERFAEITLSQRNFGFNPKGPRWRPELQRERREVLARSRNLLLFSALRAQEWVLWIDVDMIEYPADLIQQLLAVQQPVVTPHTVLPSGKTFDLNTFVMDTRFGIEENPLYLVNGIFLSPVESGRFYLDSYTSESLIPVDGVGGTVLLVQADLHRQGVIFPPYPYKGYIETEGLAMIAKDMGYTCWALPQLKVIHANA